MKEYVAFLLAFAMVQGMVIRSNRTGTGRNFMLAENANEDSTAAAIVTSPAGQNGTIQTTTAFETPTTTYNNATTVHTGTTEAPTTTANTTEITVTSSGTTENTVTSEHPQTTSGQQSTGSSSTQQPSTAPPTDSTASHSMSSSRHSTRKTVPQSKSTNIHSTRKPTSAKPQPEKKKDFDVGSYMGGLGIGLIVFFTCYLIYAFLKKKRRGSYMYGKVQ